jgi:hypothetical protein
MLGTRSALIFERRICRNRSDPQQGEQSFYTLVDIMIDAAQNRVEGLHEQLLTGRSLKLAMLPQAEKKHQCGVGLSKPACFDRATRGAALANL